MSNNRVLKLLVILMDQELGTIEDVYQLKEGYTSSDVAKAKECYHDMCIKCYEGSSIAIPDTFGNYLLEIGLLEETDCDTLVINN